MDKQSEIQLIVGLGNPGEQYQGSRHNIGFAVLQALGDRYAVDQWSEERTHLEATVEIGGRPVVLACPSTFMNRSGQAVKALVDRIGLTPAEVLVVVDDVDLALGRMRIRPKGGAGTHNGLRDICETVGDRFPRLRIGVGGAVPGSDLAAYVLSAFPDSEMQMVSRVVDQAADALEVAVNEGVNPAMNRFNGMVVEEIDDQSPPVQKIWKRSQLIPIRLASWISVDQVIIVECPRPEGRGWQHWTQWFRWWMGPQRIRLDEVGGAVWGRMDGVTALGEIADALADEMPDDREHLIARIDLFVQTLASQGLLRLE